MGSLSAHRSYLLWLRVENSTFTLTVRRIGIRRTNGAKRDAPTASQRVGPNCHLLSLQPALFVLTLAEPYQGRSLVATTLDSRFHSPRAPDLRFVQTLTPTFNGTSASSPLIPFRWHFNFLGRNVLTFKHDNATARLELFGT